MSPSRRLGALVDSPALQWILLTGTIALSCLLYVSAIDGHDTRAREHLNQRAQHLALHLTAAAQGQAGVASIQESLHQAISRAPESAILEVDDVTGGRRAAIYRSTTTPASEPARDSQQWITDVQVIEAQGKKWELRLSQPAPNVTPRAGHYRQALLAGLVIVSILSAQIWRMKLNRSRQRTRQDYELLQLVVDSLPAPVFVKDADHHYIVLNRAFGEAYGRSVEELLGKTDRALHDPDIARSRFDEDERALATDTILVSSQTEVDPQGRKRHWLKSKAALPLPSGQRGICGILMDVTAQYEAEARIRDTHAFMQSALDALPLPMYIKNDRFEWMLVNSAFTRLMNRPAEELVGQSDAEFWDTETVRRYRQHDQDALQSEDVVAREEEVHLPDGRVVNLVTHKQALTVGQARHVIGVIFDVTDLRSSSKELAHAHQFLHAIIDALPHSLVVKDESGHYLIVNHAWCEAVAIDSDKVLGRTAREIFSEAIATQLESQDAESWATGHTITAIQPRINLQGATGWSLKSKRVVNLPNGSRYNVQVTTDVTAHQQALQEAQRSRELLRGVLDAIPNPLIVKDARRHYALFNAAATQLAPPGRMRVGISDADVFPEDVCLRYADEDALALAENQPRWYADYRKAKDESERWWLKSKRGITLLHDERLIVTVLSDVTALKLAERDLLRNQSRLQVLHDLSLLMLQQADLQTLAQGACDAIAQRLDDRRVSFAMTATDGQPPMCYRADVNPSSAWSCADLDLQAIPTMLPSQCRLAMFESADLFEPDDRMAWRSIGAEPDQVATIVIPIALDGRMICLFAFEGLAARPWAPHERQLIVEAADLLRVACRAQQSESSRQAAETALRESEAELRTHRDNLQVLVDARTRELTHAMQLAEAANQSKTQFFNNMSHELRTPMNSILSFARLGLEMAQNGQLDATTSHTYLERIERGATRLLLLINDLLDLAKLESGRMNYRLAMRNVRQLIQSICEELGALATKEGVNFEVECQVASAMAWCDEVRMQQVMRNLLSNALRYSPPHSQVAIRICPTVHAVDAPDGTSHVVDALEITVTDQGPGIPPGELDLIFDKYVQGSHVRGHGTGLGLPIAREIVAHHGGTLFASNAAQGGAVMTITLPVAPRAQTLPEATDSHSTASAT